MKKNKSLGLLLGLWGTLSLILLPLFVTPAVAHAADYRIHWDITNEVLLGQSWNNKAARDLVIDCNLAVDTIESGGEFLFGPGVNAAMLRVQNLVLDATRFNTEKTNGFHFDNLFKYDDINTRWKDLEAWTSHKVETLQLSGWDAQKRNSFLCLLGLTHHAVQDFYEHSNWVKLLNPFTPSHNFVPIEFPIWDGVTREPPDFSRADEVLVRLRKSNANANPSKTEDGPNDGLQTGAYKNPSTCAWVHRHLSFKLSDDSLIPEAKVAHALAKADSKIWKDKLLGLLSEAAKNDVLSYVQQRDRNQLRDLMVEGPEINLVAVDNLVMVLNDLVGPVAISERLNAFVMEGDLRARIELEGGRMSHFSRGTFPGATITMWSISADVLEGILTSSDPVGAGQQAVARGELFVSRTPGNEGATGCPLQELNVAIQSPGASGTVTSSPAGIDCTLSDGVVSGTCRATFGFGSVVTLAARPAPGSAFDRWLGFAGCDRNSVCQVTMDQGRGAVAFFLPPQELFVAVQGPGASGTVTSSPAGIDCTRSDEVLTGTCRALFGFGTVVTLTATPAGGSAFDRWFSAPDCLRDPTCQVTMDQGRGAVAFFTVIF